MRNRAGVAVGIRGTVVIGTCAVLALPGVASAQAFRHSDPAHDVVSEFIDAPDPPEPVRIAVPGTASDRLQPAPAPDNANTDIRAFRVRHTHTRLVANIRLRDYTAGEWAWAERIRTPRTPYFLSANKVPGYEIRLILRRWAVGGLTKSVTCSGMSVAVRPALNTIRVSVPTRCLHKPRWVRIGLQYARPYNSADGALYYYIDNALRKGWDGTSAPVTRRIYAG